MYHFSYKRADRWEIYDSRDRLGKVQNGAYQPQSGERVALIYANGPIGDKLNVHHLNATISGVQPGGGSGWIFNCNNALLPRPKIGPQIHHNTFTISGGESMGLIQAEARHSGTELVGRVFANELFINGVTLEAAGRFRPFGVAVGGGETGVIHGVEIADDTGVVTVYASRAVIYDMATSDGDAARRHSITNLSCNAGLVSITTALSHGYSSGDTIIVEGADVQAFNGPQSIRVTGIKTFEFSLMTCPAQNTTTLPGWELACYRRGRTIGLRAGEELAIERVRGIEGVNHHFYKVGQVSDFGFTLLGVDGRTFTGSYEGGGRYVLRGEWEVFDNTLRVNEQSEEVQGIPNGLAGYTHDNLVLCDATHSRMLQADGSSWTATLYNDVTMNGPPGAEIGTGFRLRYVATHTAFGFNTIRAKGSGQSAITLGSSQSGPEPEWRPQYFYEYRNNLSSQESALFGYGAFDDSFSWDSVYVLEAPLSPLQAALLLGGSEHGPDLYADMDKHFHRNHFYRVSFEGPQPAYEIRLNGSSGVTTTTDLRFAGCTASGRVFSHDPTLDPISLEPDDPSWPPATRPEAPANVYVISGIPY